MRKTNLEKIKQKISGNKRLSRRELVFLAKHHLDEAAIDLRVMCGIVINTPDLPEDELYKQGLEILEATKKANMAESTYMQELNKRKREFDQLSQQEKDDMLWQYMYGGDWG
jgi:hypothetical protein